MVNRSEEYFWGKSEISLYLGGTQNVVCFKSSLFSKFQLEFTYRDVINCWPQLWKMSLIESLIQLSLQGQQSTRGGSQRTNTSNLIVWIWGVLWKIRSISVHKTGMCVVSISPVWNRLKGTVHSLSSFKGRQNKCQNVSKLRHVDCVRY